jgi:hypothetical protein
MDEIRRNELGEKLRWHMIGPIGSTLEFKRFVDNGTLFGTQDNDQGKTTQNSGVSVFVEDGPTYYDILTLMFELQYYDGSHYMLFKCDWLNITKQTIQERCIRIHPYEFHLSNTYR